MPVPYGPWYNQCVQTYGALVCDNYFNWRGDKIVIWDETTKEELWSWDTFDNYNTDDYDGVNYASGINGGNWPIGIINFEFDWTHINALTYVNNHNAIYLSSRHLSRLTKIYFNIDDYDDPINGEIIWNMGEDMPSGDVDCGDDLKFSWQHTISVLDNDNLVILDNGNLSDQYGGEDWPYGICECCNDNNPNNCSMELSSFLHDQFGCESSNECIIGQSPKFSSVPISRALEISPNEIEDGGCNAEIVWEHILDYELFGLASGGTQKLDNGNYLITTAGITSIGGVTQEVSESGQIVWEAKYNLDPAALQRAYRVSSLYPVSIYPIVKNFESTNGSPCILAHTGGSRIEFELFNNGREDEQFMCEIESIDGDWFTSVVETVFIKSGESEIVRFTGNIDNSNISTNNILITLSSVNNKNILKEYEYTVYPDDSICMSDADINFDSNVDIFDIITVSDYILYGDTFSADRECVIDLNDDMLIDIVDVLSIRNLILDS